MKVLVADDEPIARRILASSLTRLGHEVLAVESGPQALEALQGPQAPRFALLDWNMPGISGPDICRRLRQDAATQYVYAILVTARSHANDLVAGLEAGADDFVSKPFDPNELRARIRAGQRIVELHAENERSRSYVSAVLANIEAGVLLTDATHRVVFANTALTRLVGKPTDALIGRTQAEISEADPTIFASTATTDPMSADIGIANPIGRIIRRVVTAVELPEGKGQLSVYRDVTREIDQERKHRELARVDMLTGLQNRRGGEEALAAEFATARSTGRPLGVALFDIDYFKRVNDTYGHATGDRVLCAVGDAISKSARRADVVARWGGEELLAILPTAGLVQTRNFAERARQAVAQLSNQDLPKVTISAGVAELTPEDTDASMIVARADALLYEAKGSGRNAVR